ncbi:hypothetical protein CJD36_002465 [Flavipsychrobacter stenotrophus]|uniref:Uncharacterized protein n=1 Tax=Flavipsychrobacter stenotrophus TaxID=2077091 RepID=A0A2S7T1E1_9BACT|nr:hypothetical protein [Flavipsychrobacter stenotrophus]PQJ12625.1 hypothetical protein CJD36_002465 [Flavipsychrobacter stenotrophus]
MTYKIKIFIAFYLIMSLSSISNSYGQINRDDTAVLRTFLESRPIVYVDTVDGSINDLTYRLNIMLAKAAITDIRTNNRNKLILTKTEKAYLRANVGKKTVWGKDLFPDAKCITSDSMRPYLRNEIITARVKIEKALANKDTVTLREIRANRAYVFYFTKPIYLRNKTLCFITCVALCGPECGHSQTCFLKKENNEWHTLVVVSAGEF